MKDLHALVQHDAVEPLDQVAPEASYIGMDQAAHMDVDTDKVN